MINVQGQIFFISHKTELFIEGARGWRYGCHIKAQIVGVMFDRLPGNGLEQVLTNLATSHMAHDVEVADMCALAAAPG